MEGWARKRISLVLWVAVSSGALAWGPVGCSDTSRRMSEAETLQYKQSLVRTQRGEIAEVDAVNLMYHPARTKAELDRYVAELRKQFAARRDAERRAPAGSGTSSPAARSSGASSTNPQGGVGGFEGGSAKSPAGNSTKPPGGSGAN